MPTIDAVIVTRSLSDILPETIKGLKTHPFKKVIAVVARDASKPNWCDVLAMDKDKLGKARNTGADLASSEYICMVDEDIVLTPKYVGNLLGCFEDAKVAAVGGRLESSTRSLYALVKAQVFRGYCKTHSDLPCGGTIYRAETLKKARFNDNLPGGEDHELHTRLKKMKYKVVFVDRTACLHYFKGNMQNEVFLCMLSGARTGLAPCLVRAAISPLRSLLLAVACRDNIYSILIPPFYVTQWIAHVFGAFFTEKEIKAKMTALS
jgi:cellulose synthase/poly-beta-1,6-N-acetylglucosamine synthase-like glycosyltransferase